MLRLTLTVLVVLSLVPQRGAAQDQPSNPGQPPPPTASSVTAATPDVPAVPPLDYRRIFQPGDRVLFVGDEVVQQMTFTRAATAALLALMPEHGLRFFNGGYEGATARSANEWIDELLDLARPTVIFVCLGLNDGLDGQAGDDPVGAYAQHLASLARRLAAREGVRRVILLGPAAIQIGLNGELDMLGYNDVLARLSATARDVARDQRLAYVDLLAHSRAVFDAASRTEGESLTFDGRVPNDLGGVVLASILLKGLGVSSRELTPLAWSPLQARKMARIRPSLAIELPVPSLEAAQPIRDLYDSLLAHDERFFRAWRIAGKRPSAPPRGTALAAADQAWQRILAQVREDFAGRAPRGSH